jgi:hypothetical protein
MKNKKNNATGIILTALITIGFIWAIYQLAGFSLEKKPLTGEEMRVNEIEAYQNLKSIADAQRKYIKKDWDSDGKKAYAMFYVHLWRSVSLESEPIRVNLVTRELAFAMEATRPHKGYYYMDLRKRRIDIKTSKEFDYTKEWAVAALPGQRGRTGVLTFMVDQTQAIYVTVKRHGQPEYPHDPGGSGWTRIDSAAELKEFQKSVNYPVNES